MKSVKFWRREVQQLSVTERMFFRDAIRTVLAWDLLKEECIELDLIRRILESEIRVLDARGSVIMDKKKNAILRKSRLPHGQYVNREDNCI